MSHERKDTSLRDFVAVYGCYPALSANCLSSHPRVTILPL